MGKLLFVRLYNTSIKDPIKWGGGRADSLVVMEVLLIFVDTCVGKRDYIVSSVETFTFGSEFTTFHNFQESRMKVVKWCGKLDNNL